MSAVFALAILTLSLSVTLPKIRQEIQRDQEIETVHRGEQYARAIQLYYRRFRAYPTSVDALVDTNGIRFLRKRYADPLTSKDDWKPVLIGQNRAPTFMGFFGAPLGSIGIATVADDSTGSAQNSSSSSTDGSNLNSAGLPGKSSTGAGSSGGIAIIGVSPVCPRRSLLVYKTMDRYDEWEFVYDPRADGLLLGQVPTAPTNVGSPGFNSGSSGGNPPSGGSTP